MAALAGDAERRRQEQARRAEAAMTPEERQRIAKAKAEEKAAVRVKRQTAGVDWQPDSAKGWKTLEAALGHKNGVYRDDSEGRSFRADPKWLGWPANGHGWSTLSTPEDFLASLGDPVSPLPAPLAALVRDGWDPSDCHWEPVLDEWTRPEMNRP